MEKTIQIINKMQDDKVFVKYAIGGGIAALFFIEPVATYDLDVFVILPDENERIISLAPIYSWLNNHGYKPDKEQVIIEGLPVQFIPAYNDLVKTAVENSIEKLYDKTVASVVSAEYLMAIMLQTYRPKDRERLIKFIDETDFNAATLSSILEKHNLKYAFEQFKNKYYDK